jgi:hypothetical protein
MNLDDLVRGKQAMPRRQVALKLRAELVAEVQQIAKARGYPLGEVFETLISEGLSGYRRAAQRKKDRAGASDSIVDGEDLS